MNQKRVLLDRWPGDEKIGIIDDYKKEVTAVVKYLEKP